MPEVLHQALLQACVRFGGEVRMAVASEWNMTDLLVGDEGSGISEEYDLLRQALLLRWLGRPLPPAAEAWGELKTAMADTHPRPCAQQPEAAA